ncbi:hypothetical protein M2352_005213 [Azospirillum fermentarium]|uniref:hypothetical protein n=1 Tax=Azospirillum fermentarium TaxID=1233114 RepID=UPI002225D9EC|nr:hypothetical protein [Azospirillum fermentarium]MCW2249530.1 hypothetical protein [Azospirillum fermentarium]
MAYPTFRAFQLPADFAVQDAGAAATPRQPEIEARIEAIWQQEMERRHGKLFNGQLFSITGPDVEAQVAEGRLTGRFVEYRDFLAQLRDPSLFPWLSIRPLAVTGITHTPEGLLFGQRTKSVSQGADQWELVPAGGFSPHAREPSGDGLSLRRQVLEELSEEVNLGPETVASETPLLVLADDESHVHDIFIELALDLSVEDVEAAFARRSHDEYANLAVVPLARLEAFLDEPGRILVPSSRYALTVCGLIAAGGSAPAGNVHDALRYVDSPADWNGPTAASTPDDLLEDLWGEFHASLRFLNACDADMRMLEHRRSARGTLPAAVPPPRTP